MRFQGKDTSEILSDLSENHLSNTWPGNFVSLLLNHLPVDELIKKAHDNDSQKTKENLCEAYYFLGQYYLLHKDYNSAKVYFQKCIDTGVRHFNEYDGAVFELNNLSTL